VNNHRLPPDDARALTEAGNPYAAPMQQPPGAASPDPDAGAPELGREAVRRLNRRVLVFFSGILLLVVLAGLWIFTALLNRNSEVKKPREEMVSIPPAPRPQLPPPPPPPPSPPAPPPAAMPAAAPIALAPKALLPPLPRSAPPPAPAPAPAPQKQAPTLLERRIADSAASVSPIHGAGAAGLPPSGAMPFAGGITAGAPNAADAPPNRAYAAKPLAPTSSAQQLTRAATLMLRGTYIRCVLETHIVTDMPGFTACVVTEPVYSFSGKRLLLPKGSKVLGRYDTEPNGPRVGVIWDRIVTPTGIDVNMASPGVDNLGGAGHVGDRDEHWGARIGAAMLISLFSDAFKYAAAEHGPRTSTVATGGAVVQSPFESNTAHTLQNMANQAARRAANRPATVTIHQGTVVNVYVAKDVDFSGVVSRY
jgi:type IV secretion system protein VirB10